MLINSRFVKLPPWACLFFSRDIWTEPIGSRGVTVQSAEQPITWMYTKGELLPGAPLLLLILSATLLPHWVQFHLILSFTSGGILIKPAKRVCGQSPAAMTGKLHQCPAICLFKTLRQRLINDLVQDKWDVMLLTCEVSLACLFSADKVQELISKCLQARDTAYCPYSRFPVGAAVLSADGAIITGDSLTVGGGRVIPILKFVFFLNLNLQISWKNNLKINF